MPVFVKASKRAKAYTRSTAKHRMFNKVFNKGSHHKRALRLYNKTSGDLGLHNASSPLIGVVRMKRGKQLNKRLQYLRSFLSYY